MTYTVGDGDKLKIRVSRARDSALAMADEFLKLAANALHEGDNQATSALLECSRKIREAVKKLREKMP